MAILSEQTIERVRNSADIVEVISKYTAKIFEIWSKGNSVIENSLYHINFGDWVSWYLSELNSVNAIEINVINFLKKELSKIK